MVARSSDLPGVITALMIKKMVEGYSSAFIQTGPDDADPVSIPAMIELAMHDAGRRSWKHLADERIEGEAVLPLGSRFRPLSKDDRHAVDEIFKQEDVRHLVTKLRGSGEPARNRVKGAAFWRKGCRSLGRLRVAALLQVGKGRDRRFRLMDIKEATAAAAPHDEDEAMPEDYAERIQTGALALSPYL
jgi:uncharacterized protein (DUF2252 family)